jgi:hypothetical protein
MKMFESVDFESAHHCPLDGNFLEALLFLLVDEIDAEYRIHRVDLTQQHNVQT